MSDDLAAIELTPIDTIPTTTSLPLAPQLLRLHHLFTMTAVVAVLMWANRPQDVPGFTMPPAIKLAFEGLGVVAAIINAVAITAVLNGLVWRWKGYRFFHEPGHWIMVSMAIAALVGMLTVLVISVTMPSDFTNPDQLNYVAVFASSLIFPLITIGLVLMNVYIGRTKCVEHRWQQVFYAKAGEIVPVLGTLAVLWLLDRAVRNDRPQHGGRKLTGQQTGFVPLIAGPVHPGHPRDRAHWCGVILQFAACGMTLLTLAGMIAWLFLHFMS